MIELKKEPKPWVVREDKIIVEGWPYIRLHEQVIDLPDGTHIDRFWLMEYPSWIAVLAVAKNGEIVLIRQYRHGAKKVVWELPAGIVDDGEEPLVAAQRELLEETGYGGGDWQLWVETSANPSTHTNRTYCYLALGVEKIAAQNLDHGEEVAVYPLPPETVRELLLRDEVAQALHVGPLWKYLAELTKL